jgi:hypothetical protein
MTLDSDPADHQRLDDCLEGWSLFAADRYFFVVRLVSAGTYDRRAAYFAHGRAWEIDALKRGEDPGLYLGRSEAFDKPWQEAPPATPASIDVPARWPQQVKTEPEKAARFLGHLLQAMTASQQLVIAVPLEAFTAGAPLHGLVCFARATLPADLRKECRIRIYSRMPELFLRHLGASLVVVPEDAASSALTARPTATLIDADGNRIAGKQLDARALDFANAIVERATAIPDAVPYFSERMRRAEWKNGLPSAGEIRALQITYNVAFAFAGPPEHQAELLKKYLPRAAAKLGPGLPWDDLISEDQWLDFPADAVVDLLLTDSRGSSEGGREFLARVEDQAARRGLDVDARLNEWWDPEDPGKVRRLLELLAHSPPLVSADAATARTTDIPIEQLARAGPVRAVIDAEAKRGWLSRRAHESAALAEQARDAAVFDILTAAVCRDNFDSGWARTYIRATSPETLVQAAEKWMREPRFWTNWGNVPKQLLDRLRELTPPPASLTDAVRRGLDLDPVDHFDVHVRSADVVARIDAAKTPVLERLWRALPRLTEARRDHLESLLLDPAWPGVKIANVDTETLLTLAGHFKKSESFDAFYGELDQRMQASPDLTTRILTRSGWWFFWRSRTRLTDSDTLQQSAFAWLTSDAWNDGAHATLEAWNTVINDLPPKISGAKMAELRGHGTPARRPWPWIPPFESEQLDALIARADDLGALAEIADALQWDASKSPFTKPPHAFVLERSNYVDQLPATALAWLSSERRNGQPESLTIAHSATVYRYSGEHHLPRATEARIAALKAGLEDSPADALAAASVPNLWNDTRFVRELGRWMNDRGSVKAIGESNVKRIEENVSGEVKAGIKASQPLVKELEDGRYKRTARMLNPHLAEKIERDTIHGGILDALVRGHGHGVCWEQLANEIRKALASSSPRRHPVLVIADQIRGKGNLSKAQKRELAANGWQAFEKAAQTSPILIGVALNAPVMPALYLATSMLGAGSLGTAALQVAFASSNHGLRLDPAWWRCLLRSIYTFKRHDRITSADDRADMALAAIRGGIDRPEERAALLEAARSESNHNPYWTLRSELGMRL